MTVDEIRAWMNDCRNVAACLPANITLEGTLDAGGQGLVYRGQVDKKPAAVKIYYPGQIDKRIQREVDALRTLQCRSIVSFLWAGTINVQGTELAIMATSLVDGQSLEKATSGKPMALEQIGAVAFDGILAIDAMWQQRIVHRDLKPSNIILQTNGRAMVIDLGVARHLGKPSLTAYGSFWGTPGYFSPEQMRAVRMLTCKSDLFSLGIVLVEALLGYHPTQRDQDRLISAALHEKLPVSLNAWKHADLLRRMLAPHPTMRPHPREVLGLLQEYDWKGTR